MGAIHLVHMTCLFGSYQPKMYNWQFSIPFLLYCLYQKYVCHIKHFTTIFKFSGHVRLRRCLWLHMLSSFEHQLPINDVGLWPKIEGFCYLHSKLMVIFLKYLLLAVTQQCSAKVIYMGQCFFKYWCANNAQFFLTRSILIHLWCA